MKEERRKNILEVEKMMWRLVTEKKDEGREMVKAAENAV